MDATDIASFVQGYELSADKYSAGAFVEIGGSNKNATLTGGAVSFDNEGLIDGLVFSGTNWLTFDSLAVGEITIVVVARVAHTSGSGIRTLVGTNGGAATDQLFRAAVSGDTSLALLSHATSLSTTGMPNGEAFVATYVVKLGTNQLQISVNGGAVVSGTGTGYGRIAANCVPWSIGAHRAGDVVLAGTWIGAVYLFAENLIERDAANWAALVDTLYERATEWVDPPVNTAVPVVTGTPTVNALLTVSEGLWSGDPTLFYYQWYVVDGATNDPIELANSSSYTVAPDVAGEQLRVGIVTENAYGVSAEAFSAATAAVAGIAPSNTTLPSITGTLEVGQTILINDGVWNGVPEPTFAYELLDAADDSVIATTKTVLLTEAMEDLNVKPRVTATNFQGSASATGATVGPIDQAPFGEAVLSDFTVTATGETTAEFAITTDRGGGTMSIGIFPNGATVTDPAKLAAGTDDADNPAVWFGAFPVAGVDTYVEPIDGLSAGTTYDAYAVQHTPNASNIVTDEFATDTPDIIPPVLSSMVANPGADDRWGELSVSTDTGEGTLWWVVATAGAPAPNAAQVKAGTDGAGAAAAYASSTTVSSTGTKTKRATGLGSATAYVAYAMHEDALGNQSTVASDGFTTDVLVAFGATTGVTTKFILGTGGANLIGSVADPNGGNNAISFSDNGDGTTGPASISFNNGGSLTVFNGVNRFRVKMKLLGSPPTNCWCRVRAQNFTTNPFVHPNLSNGTFGGDSGALISSSIESLGSGWYQVDFVHNMAGADLAGIVAFQLGNSGSGTTVLRNGTYIVAVYDFRVTRAS